MPEQKPSEVSPRSPHVTAEQSESVGRQPVGLIGPEWALRKSARGAALWRHAGVMASSGKDRVEVLALDREAKGRRFTFRDEWNVPAPGAKFRVRRLNGGDRAASFDEISCARLEGAVLDWVRARNPRIVHVLGLDGFGPGVLLALEAAGIPTVLTLDRLRELKAAMERDEAKLEGARETYAAALSSARRIVVRATADAAAAETVGAPREKIRVMKAGADGEMPILRAYASLYRLLAPIPEATEEAATAL